MFRRSRREEMLGIALTGGGARAATQVGALRALSEAGIVPDIIAGTSAGAINAAWYALHPQGISELCDIWYSLHMRDVFPGNRARMIMNLARHGYVHDSATWERAMRARFGDARIEDAAVRLCVAAGRLRDGRRVVFESGEIVPALMASSAIPGVFPPYRIGDELYIDGGVLEYAPLPTLQERGASTMYVLDCSGFSHEMTGKESVADRAGIIASAAAVTAAAARAESQGAVCHVLSPEIPFLQDGRDFSRTSELIQIGYDHARRYLSDTGTLTRSSAS